MKIVKIKSNKKGVAGEGLLTIYRLVLISLIALIILGLSAVFYDYYLDVRDVEARVLAKQIVNCLASEGILDLDGFSDDKENKENALLDYCGIKNTKRFYVKVNVTDFLGDDIRVLEQGDSGVMWVKEIFEGKAKTEKIAKYEPGYFAGNYSVVIENEGAKINGEIFVEVLVSHEF